MKPSLFFVKIKKGIAFYFGMCYNTNVRKMLTKREDERLSLSFERKGKKVAQLNPEKKNKRSGVASLIKDAIEPTVISMGYILWDVEFVKEGSELDLVISIDREEGISLDDCEAVTRAVDPIIDSVDPIEQNYYLEVSSTGSERVLRTDFHLEYCRGWMVSVSFFAPLGDQFGDYAGQKQLKGVLLSHDKDCVSVAVGDSQITVLRSSIAKIKTLDVE